MQIAVVVATLGRPQEVGQLLERLALQTVAPSVIVLSVETKADLPEPLADDVKVVMGSKGLPAQRNRGLDVVAAIGADIVVFFDDDYLPSNTALSEVGAFFLNHADVVAATGLVLADGIGRGGLDYERALNILSKFDDAPKQAPRIERDVRGVYGCNMAFRTAALGETRFDEKLPLYGWQEDVDFAARLLPSGRVVKTNAFAGVHRGVTRGRTSGVKLGFSQMVNPVYLVRKGTMQRRHAANIMLRNLVANHFRAFWPEAWIDRPGRMRGNWLGLRHLLSGKVDPTTVLEIS